MIFHITATTDGQFLGKQFDSFPLVLGDMVFEPSAPPIKLSGDAWRFYNSNYSIDVQEI